MPPIIDVRDLVKVYGGVAGRGEPVRAVDSISFSVEEGEFFGFLGPNAAGKTTTIRILTTLLTKTSGSVAVGGHEVGRGAAAIRRMIGYTGQSIGVDGDLTGRENLTLIGHLYHLPRDEIRRRVEDLLTVLQLAEAADRPAITYSGGMRRRLDLGAGLVNLPRILFLDEPTTGLDPQTRNAVWDYLRRLHKEEGMTIFLTTQYMEEADRLCERLVIMDQGRIVTEGSPAKLKAEIGADVITVHLKRTDDFARDRDKAVNEALRVEGVLRATPFDEGVSVHAQDGGATLLEVLRRLESSGIAVRQVSIAQPSLDEVFLQHTGREMRVEEVKPMRYPGARRQ